MTVAAVVLAAGAGSRFGGGKLLAPLAGRPLLQHVLDTLAAAGLERVVVVLGDDEAAVRAAIAWRAEEVVRNPDPGRGLASSLQVGLAALEEGASPDDALIALGDQPDLRADVIAALLAADGGDRAVVPRYAADHGRNPVLLPRALWPAAASLTGDQGLGPWLAAHPEQVLEVPVSGSNPDVDRPADLVALSWARRVRANREQVDRFREAPDGPDFYASTSSIFRADPNRTDDPVVDALVALARPSDVWLDVGAGAGRYALPLARHVREVIAIEPSPGMAADMREVAAEHGIANVRHVDARWPMAAPPSGDVTLIAHVGYDIEAIGPFVDALEAAAPRRVALLMAAPPAMAAAPAFEAIHGEARVPLPALPEFVALLRARGVEPAVRMIDVPPATHHSFDVLLAGLRRQTWVAPDGENDRRLVDFARTHAIRDGDEWRLVADPLQLGVVTWGAWDR